MSELAVLKWLIPVLLGWFCLSLFYWRIVWPVCRDAIIFRIYAQRDRLRAMAIDGDVDPRSFSYRYMERLLCQGARVAPCLTVRNFVRFRRAPCPQEILDAKQRFAAEASPELIEMHDNAIITATGMIAVNSPLMSLVGLVVICASSAKEWYENKIHEFCEVELVGTQYLAQLRPA